MSTVASALGKLHTRLSQLYGSDADHALQLILQEVDRYLPELTHLAQNASGEPAWDQRDVVLITYGDQVVDDGVRSPLATQLSFLREHDLTQLINTIHFLPFFPYSSDDGFSVIDYREVDPALGTWEDIESFGEACHLMFDFVVNHVSQDHRWFREFLNGNPDYDDYFIETDPTETLDGVTRPRALPLLHEFPTPAHPDRSSKWIWTTFSRDQVDLNYSNPEVLAEAVSVLLDYIARGARIIRLDAIAYLWKRLGTSCIHLDETHVVVKIFREILDAVAPQVILLTETNVPHEENVSYFGNGDEAHMVYQFSLPPLLIDAFLHEDATPLQHWLSELEPPAAGTTYFNFTASHDGIGVRPLEGRVDAGRLASLVEKIRRRGGLVNLKRNADGSETPYELNITYLDALSDEHLSSEIQIQRFLATQTIMMSLQGIPAIYFHSLVGTPNDYAGVEASGINRRINRRKYRKRELEELLADSSVQAKIFCRMQERLGIRIRQPAFHPDATQHYRLSGQAEVLVFERSCPDQRILVVSNVSTKIVQWKVPSNYQGAADLLSDHHATDSISLAPASVMWLEMRS